MVLPNNLICNSHAFDRTVTPSLTSRKNVTHIDEKEIFPLHGAQLPKDMCI